MTVTSRVSRPVRAPRLVLPVVLSGTFVQLLSVTVMQVAVPDVQRDLGAGPGTGQLVLAGYTLTFACSLITSARLGDRHGYRRLFVLGMAVFTVAAVIAAVAPTAGPLVGGRLLQGLGSGLMAPQILSIIQTALPDQRRARALGAYGATMALASLAGPLLGGVLLQADPLGLGWRAAMLLPVPVGVLALLLAPALPAGGGRRGRESRVDAVGAGLSLAGFALLVLPLTLGRDADWPLWTWLSLALAAVLLAGFAVAQRRVAHPLIHPTALAEPATRWGIGLVFVFNAGVPSFTLLLSLHAQGALGYSPLWTAMVITPYAAGALVGSVLAERLGRRFGATALTASAAAFAAVCLLVAVTLGVPGLGWVLALVLAVGGFGFGVFTASVFAQILARVRPAAVSSLSGLLPTAQQLGGTLGVAIAGVVYFGPAPDAGSALWHAMTYQAVVFAAAAGMAAVVARARPAGPPTVDR
ncbi:MFS transporter [Goodfellowiella coeruleoviolacea]|uniref:Arabinose efflux permease, MFS family n=1 Tax=Goodfellowiella coeruleoviolacea TaxID=334858 RepID=A0AAE3KHT4_9PSEU|nr:MFS transporter [Goodfellowiella coeruleoviolacea]MCP2168591.1 putative arabinose efflux permease, MFS family [Goodfellowiella coeruleoviolacea]